jgi:hypothetical protein
MFILSVKIRKKYGKFYFGCRFGSNTTVLDVGTPLALSINESKCKTGILQRWYTICLMSEIVETLANKDVSQERKVG